LSRALQILGLLVIRPILICTTLRQLAVKECSTHPQRPPFALPLS